MTGSAGSLIMNYKNHPMKAGGRLQGRRRRRGFTVGSTSLSPTPAARPARAATTHRPRLIEGGYYVQSFPHYTPGYYKFMAAQNQAAFDTPATAAEYMVGREGFYNSGFGTRSRPGKPAIMNDGYCTKCHNTVGTDY